MTFFLTSHLLRLNFMKSFYTYSKIPACNWITKICSIINYCRNKLEQGLGFDSLVRNWRQVQQIRVFCQKNRRGNKYLEKLMTNQTLILFHDGQLCRFVQQSVRQCRMHTNSCLELSVYGNVRPFSRLLGENIRSYKSGSTLSERVPASLPRGAR